MNLKIEDMKGVTYATDNQGIEKAFRKRYGRDINEYWISHNDDDYPVLGIVVNGDLASISYFPEPDHPGFKSVGDLPGLKKGESSTFYVNTPTEIHLVLNDSIVPVSRAVEAVQEFLLDKGLPKSIQWLEL
jgi:hypothetical protein